jgi:hypothetical protein
MTRALVILNSQRERDKAISWIKQVPFGTRVEFKYSKRTLPQNARMWGMLSDIATQVSWHGVKLSAEDWKIIFLSALKKELRMVPNISGDGFVQLGRSSSDLSKSEMSDMQELMAMFGAENGVVFHSLGERE